jgi:hypothetical protein
VWFNDTVAKGAQGSERAGLLELMDSTMKTSMASAQLGSLGIVRYAPEPVKSGTSSGLVQVDMYCESLNLKVL